MRECYGKLLTQLQKGFRAAMITRLDATGAVKTVCSEETPELWARLLADTETGAFVTDGPVSHAEREDGLTVVEFYTPKPRMLIFGGGHIALALTKMAKMTDFHVVVFDDRPMYANPGRFPEADEVICDDFSRAFDRIRVRETDYAVIVTRGHRHDTECLEGILRGAAPAYTGMIGSRRRVAIVLKQLERQGHRTDALARIHTPIGLRIGAVTPAEISVSILSEIIQVKRLERGAIEGRTSDVEIVEWLARRGDEADALITILSTQGSVPRETGAKMAMTYEGRTVGTIGGGCAESDVTARARTVIREGGYALFTADMSDTAEDDGMVCGGAMRVMIERARKPADLG
ncbi:MAG: XdhC family protein [Clostridiales Family XIII bacterium]|jgi:xanthine dehydrogenase accessory factor|nr:XdhC family protein [Clostridiales Family XIII bacterium]